MENKFAIRKLWKTCHRVSRWLDPEGRKAVLYCHDRDSWSTEQVRKLYIRKQYSNCANWCSDITAKKFYSRHKKMHCLSNETVTAPNSIVIHLFCHFEGNQLDLDLYLKSGIDDADGNNLLFNSEQFCSTSTLMQPTLWSHNCKHRILYWRENRN